MKLNYSVATEIRGQYKVKFRFSVAYQPSFAMRLSHLSAESKVNS